MASAISMKTVSLMSDKIADHFKDIKKAFKYVDVNGDGVLNRQEIERAMDLWNIPIDKVHT